MFEREISKFKSLNRFAQSNGIVIMGEAEDADIPLGELKQAFSLTENIYNRSISGLFVSDAEQVYEECIAELCPETVLIHIGESDLSAFASNETAFDECYRALIKAIRAKDKRTRIVIVSLKNHENDTVAAMLNKCLKTIADSEKCEFADVSAKVGSGVKENRDVMSFLYDIGFDGPLHIKRPLGNLVRILFGCSDWNTTATPTA